MSSVDSKKQFTRREFVRRGGLGATAVAASGLLCAPRPAPAAEPARRRPNVLFILTDDQNNDTLGCFGGKVLTPNIDNLAREGARFARAYTSSSVCTPSRYTCLTGQYASRCESPGFMRICPPGTPSNVGFNVAVTPGSLNVGKVLHDAGYATGFVGKWHTGTPPLLKYAPDADMRDPQVARTLAENQRRIIEHIKQCGFDYAASVYRGNLKDHRLDALVFHNMEWVTKGALDFIEQYKDRPFFLHICPTLQHSPNPLHSIPGDPRMTPAGMLPEPLEVQAPRASIAPRLKAAGVPAEMAHATWLDDGVGAVLKKLEDRGLADNTVVIFFSDNATLGGKGTCYEGGARTPALMHWKGRVPPGVTCDKLVENIDFVPTILDLCGVTPPAQMRTDGTSLLPMLAGREARWRDALFLEIGHTRGVCTQRWKYVALRYPPKIEQAIKDGTLGRPPYHMDSPIDLQQAAVKAHPCYWDADQLYDLQNDPGEKVNLAKDPRYAKTVEEMKSRLRERLASFPRPFGEFHA